MIYIFWTCRSREEAKTMIYSLLNQKLIACGSIFPEVESIYCWAEKIEESHEIKVILKTQAHHFDSIQQYIETHSSYEVPEIVAIDALYSNPRYTSWLDTATKNT